MTRDEWRRIKAITADAWEQPASARADFVAAACAGDESLRSEVERLLQSTDAASELFEAPTLASKDVSDALAEVARVGPASIGTGVGPYRIARELGHGGMGRVYLAERIDGEFDQSVASSSSAVYRPTRCFAVSVTSVASWRRSTIPASRG